MSDQPAWTLDDLRTHLQFAVDLEMYTVPYYISAMYSIVDRSDPAFQLIQSVVYQEMLHLQLAANVANAYGTTVTIEPPEYGGELPHLTFVGDHGNPLGRFSPFSTEIGPLDELRLNAMCLVEYPEYARPGTAELRPIEKYDSIGHFYDAVAVGAEELAESVVGDVNQVDAFGRFYADMDTQKVTASGTDGWEQARHLIDAIVEQGEGQRSAHSEIRAEFRNTADDPAAVLDHYDKFLAIRQGGGLPAVYPVTHTGSPSPEQTRLAGNFARFCDGLTNLFQGRAFEDPPEGVAPSTPPLPPFEVLMAQLGSNITTCWQAGATPLFSLPATPEGSPS